MASSMTKNMEEKLYAMINCLADNYGFDADTAFEFVRWETDTDHVGEIFNLIGAKEEKKTEEPKDDVSEAPTESTTGGDITEKIAACKKNISNWEKKLADGKSKDADKQREKVTKEKAKLTKLEAKMPKVVEAKKPEPKAEPKKAEEKEKRIKRFSPVMATQLKTALDGVCVEMSDKLKKEFQQYIEDLTDADYRASGLGDHMRAFAKLKAPTKASSEVSSLIKEMDDLMANVTVAESTSNAAGGGPKIVDVTIDDLRKLSMTAELDTPGTYWDTDNGRFVKGPESDEDEDVVEAKFNNKDYVVGEKTGRVYEVRDTGDIFAGFAGVGKFKGMSVA